MIQPKTIRPSDPVNLQDHSALSTPQDLSRPSHPHSPFNSGTLISLHSDQPYELSDDSNGNQHYINRKSAWDKCEAPQLNTGIDHEISNNTSISYNKDNTLLDRNSPTGSQDEGQTVLMNEDCDMNQLDVDDGLDDDHTDKASSSPSIEDEDIDFQFVYALHTFIATIEGQANATKGDTMVLLDDTNSYWWLVRVVKDSSIGYLPAEHIETPTERLARLNKHRNIDLTSSMLGDQGEKHVNPLVKAFRKRNTKVVAFAEPTYFEASEYEYSSAEEEYPEYYGHMNLWDPASNHQEKLLEDEKSSSDSLENNSESKAPESDGSEQDTNLAANKTGITRKIDEPLDGVEGNKSCNGSLNTNDSLFQYDSVETRKITLTPNLLRDDSNLSSGKASNESKELKRPSFERPEKESFEKIREKFERKDKKDKDKDKDKEKEKDKDKKSGILSGLFKRKDRRNRSLDEDLDISAASKQRQASPAPIKNSDEIPRDQNLTQSQELSSQFNKSQNLVNDEISSRQIVGTGKELKELTQASTNDSKASSDDIPPDLTHIGQFDKSQKQEQTEISPESILSAPVTRESKSGNFIPMALQKKGSPDSRSAISNKSMARDELDQCDLTSDLPDDMNFTETKPQIKKASFSNSSENASESPVTSQSVRAEERLSESPIQSYTAKELQVHVSDLLMENMNQNELHSSASSASPVSMNVEDTPTKLGAGSSTSLATTATYWNDVQLRNFFEDDSEIKDLLIVVYDNSGVVPAGPDHPIAGSLFKEENEKLADIANRLDGILDDWLARKSRTRGGS